MAAVDNLNVQLKCYLSACSKKIENGRLASFTQVLLYFIPTTSQPHMCTVWWEDVHTAEPIREVCFMRPTNSDSCILVGLNAMPVDGLWAHKTQDIFQFHGWRPNNPYRPFHDFITLNTNTVRSTSNDHVATPGMVNRGFLEREPGTSQI
jgi:hypothetical protein